MSSTHDAIVLKRQQREDAIPKEWRISSTILSSFQQPLEASPNNMIGTDVVKRSGILTEREMSITDTTDAALILRSIANGDYSATEVTVAYCKRAAVAHQLTNCLTEILFDQALERAQELDASDKAGKPLGPLHGLPVSLKDSFQIAGVSSTLGLAAWADHVSSSNAPLVNMLLDMGAVIYCKTNVPQLLMAGESDNVIFGRTLNPHNTGLTAGGSSGGEGALVAMRGAPIGVGTDIAGSIRIPSLCCGIYGFKPTAFRLPHSGLQACYDPHLPIIAPSIGPFANDIDSLVMFSKAIIDAKPTSYDPTVLDVGWRTKPEVRSGKLRIGVLAEDPVFPLHPPTRHTLLEASRALEANGHELIQLQPEECQIMTAAQIVSAMLGLDKVPGRILEAGQEDLTASVRCVAEQIAKMPRDAVSDLDSVSDLEKLSGLHKKRAQYVSDWSDIWKNHRLDAVIAPVAQSTAVRHDTFGPLPYTEFLDLLDYPACAIPFGQVNSSRLTGSFELVSGQVAPPYEPEALVGAPCGIQIFTRRMRDDECLAIAKVVDECLNGSQGC